MALLGLVTALALSGTPGLPPAFTDKVASPGVSRPDDGTFTGLGLTGTPVTNSHGSFTKVPEATSPRPDDGTFTYLALTGTPRSPWGDFTGKTLSEADTKVVTDTYLVVMTLASVDAVDIDVEDFYRPVLTMSTSVGRILPVIDTYRPQWAMTVGQLTKSGTTNFPVTDTYRAVLTMATPSLSFSQSVTDTYRPVLTMSATVQGVDEGQVTDTYTVVMTMDYALTATAAFVNWDVTDTYTPVVGMTAQVNTGGDVDRIHIHRHKRQHIRITRR